MTHDEMIAVIQAHKDGKEIEFRFNEHDSWDIVTDPIWDFSVCEYRIKPPQIEAWACIRDGVVISVHKSEPNPPMNTDRYYDVIRLIPGPNYMGE